MGRMGQMGQMVTAAAVAVAAVLGGVWAEEVDGVRVLAIPGQPPVRMPTAQHTHPSVTTALGGVSNRLDGLESGATTLTGRVESLEARVGTNETEIAAAAAAAELANARAGTNEAAVAVLETNKADVAHGHSETNGMQAAVDLNAARIGTNAAEIAVLETNKAAVVHTHSETNGIQAAADLANARAGTNEAAIAVLETNTSALVHAHGETNGVQAAADLAQATANSNAAAILLKADVGHGHAETNAIQAGVDLAQATASSNAAAILLKADLGHGHSETNAMQGGIDLALATAVSNALAILSKQAADAQLDEWSNVSTGDYYNATALDLLLAGYVPTTAPTGNWTTAYTDRLKWDGGSDSLVAATGRTSLGLSVAATQTVTTAWGATSNATLASTGFVQGGLATKQASDSDLTTLAAIGIGAVQTNSAPTGKTGAITTTASAITNDASVASDLSIVNADQDKDVLIRCNDGGTMRTAIQVNGDTGSVTMPQQSYVRASTSSNKTINNTTATTVAFDTETTDTLGEYNPVSGVFTATDAGNYVVSYGVTWKDLNTSGAYYNSRIVVGGATRFQQTHSPSAATTYLTQTQTATIALEAGDTVTITVYQSSGGAEIIYGTDTTLGWLTIQKAN